MLDDLLVDENHSTIGVELSDLPYGQLQRPLSQKLGTFPEKRLSCSLGNTVDYYEGVNKEKVETTLNTSYR